MKDGPVIRKSISYPFAIGRNSSEPVLTRNGNETVAYDIRKVLRSRDWAASINIRIHKSEEMEHYIFF
jgi:hypothetical protein